MRSVAFRTWVLARLPLLVSFALIGAGPAQALLVDLATRHPGAHGAVKLGLLWWQAGLLRSHALPLKLLLGAAVVLGGSRLPRRAWPYVVPIAALAVTWAWRSRGLPAALLGALLIAANAAPAAWYQDRRLATLVGAVPGIGLLLPRPVAHVLWRPAARLDALAAVAGGVFACFGWFVADILGDIRACEAELARWPAAYVDPRATEVMKVEPPGVFDFQEIDRVGDRIVVIAESPPRLLSFPIAGGEPSTWPLRPFWANGTGMAVETASDPATGRTWVLAGPHTVAGARHVDGAWRADHESPRLADNLLHGSMHWFADQNRLAMITLNVAQAATPSVLYLVDTPELGSSRALPLRTREGKPMPVLRDTVWLPTIGRFALAPDFGDRLWLADPDNGVCEPWLEMSTLNGKLIWDDTLQRLFVARPDEAELLVVDPVRGVVEKTLPTQRGVRAVAVDATRGLVLTGSVLTGSVEVRRLSDGERVDVIGGFMPMVRHLQLVPERGEAWLSTWAALYRFPYVAAGG